MELGDVSQGADQDSAPRKQDRRRLPPELTGLLTRSYEHGLDHWTRRRILRALHARKGGEVSPAELVADDLPDLSLSDIGYHVRVLRGRGMIHLARTQQVRGVIRHLYVSNMEDEPTVLSVLAQTEELDRVVSDEERNSEST